MKPALCGLGLLPVLLLVSCARSAAPDAGIAAEELPPEISVHAGRGDLVFSYRDPETGQLATTASIAAIPAAARAQVIVTDLTLTPEQRRADRYIYLANLEAPRPDGTYPVAIASRYSATLGAGEGAGAAAGEGVVVYTTSWCGVCKKAKRLLQQLGVPFVEKDIEASKRAAEELSAKARAAGVSASGVPVIDVAGTLLQGLDEATLRSVLKEKGLLGG